MSLLIDLYTYSLLLYDIHLQNLVCSSYRKVLFAWNHGFTKYRIQQKFGEFGKLMLFRQILFAKTSNFLISVEEICQRLLQKFNSYS